MLVVDDNATNRRVLALQTAKWGMMSRATESPLEALRWLEHGDPFDVAILDMHMPEMDGLALAREIRERRAALPLVLFSSLGRREAVGNGGLFSAYLGKPIHQSHLYDTLVGLFAETPPAGFGFSDTAFRIFILMASRRLQSDRFLTVDFRPEVYTPFGMDWVANNGMTSANRLIRSDATSTSP